MSYRDDLRTREAKKRKLRWKERVMEKSKQQALMVAVCWARSCRWKSTDKAELEWVKAESKHSSIPLVLLCLGTLERSRSEGAKRQWMVSETGKK